MIIKFGDVVRHRHTQQIQQHVFFLLCEVFVFNIDTFDKNLIGEQIKYFNFISFRKPVVHRIYIDVH